MKRTLLVIVAIALCVTLNAQERVNREKVNYTKVSGVLDKATGWAYNKMLGEWIDYENIICSSKDYKEKYRSLNGSKYMKSRYTDFITIQAKQIFVEGKEWYVIVVHSWDGAYKYPAIQEDWYEYITYKYYIITKDEYTMLFELTNEPVTIMAFIEEQLSSISTPEEDFVVDRIRGIANSTHYARRKDAIKAYKATDGSIRFQLEPRNLFWDDAMEYQYFEVSESDWLKLKID